MNLTYVRNNKNRVGYFSYRFRLPCRLIFVGYRHEVNGGGEWTCWPPRHLADRGRCKYRDECVGDASRVIESFDRARHVVTVIPRFPSVRDRKNKTKYVATFRHRYVSLSIVCFAYFRCRYHLGTTRIRFPFLSLPMSRVYLRKNYNNNNTVA